MFSLLTLLPLLALLTPTRAQQQVPVTIVNSCSTSISPRFIGTNNGLANPAPLAPGGRVTVRFDPGFAGAIFVGESEQGATRAEFVMNYGRYYISLVRGFNLGISIDPLAGEDVLYPSGFCPTVTCATSSCPSTSATRSPLTITAPEPPREGPAQPPPTPPLYGCVSSNGQPSASFPLGYTVTFCPGGSPPSTPTPTPTPNPPPPTSNALRLSPNGDRSKCLDLSGNNRYNGAPVQIWDCNGTPAQNWVLNRGAGRVELQGSGYCLDAGSAPGNGVGMKIWQCYDNLPAQNWYYTGDNRIAVTGQGQCLDLPSGNKNNGNRVQTWACGTGNNNQVWTSS